MFRYMLNKNNRPEVEHKPKWHKNKAKDSTTMKDRESSIKIAAR
jgi:hypothetical protein